MNKKVQIGDLIILDKPIHLRFGKTETVCIVVGIQHVMSRSNVLFKETRLLTSLGLVCLGDEWNTPVYGYEYDRDENTAE